MYISCANRNDTQLCNLRNTLEIVDNTSYVSEDGMLLDIYWCAIG